MAELKDLLGIKIADLTPADLAQLKSALAGITQQVDQRSDEIKKTLETEVFGAIAKSSADLMINKMAFAKLPKLSLTPSEDGKSYVVAYVADTKKSGGKKAGDGAKRTTASAETGKITINKIGIAKGGIAMFQDNLTKKQYEDIKSIVKDLKQPGPDGKPTTTSEADRCWDISKKGISASEIITRYHADQVTLIYNDGKEQVVKDAVTEMEAARKAVTAQEQPAQEPPAQEQPAV